MFLANRLSEDPGRSVLLLEAGPDYPGPDQLPDELKYDMNQAASEEGAAHNWSLVGKSTEAQERLLHVARGKVTGGSSAINHQILLRGAPEDFDGWAAAGNDEWSYQKNAALFPKVGKRRRHQGRLSRLRRPNPRVAAPARKPGCPCRRRSIARAVTPASRTILI